MEGGGGRKFLRPYSDSIPIIPGLTFLSPSFALLFTILDNKVLQGLHSQFSVQQNSADVQTKRSSFVYPSPGLSFEDKLKFLMFCSLIIEALHRLG